MNPFFAFLLLAQQTQPQLVQGVPITRIDALCIQHQQDETSAWDWTSLGRIPTDKEQRRVAKYCRLKARK